MSESLHREVIGRGDGLLLIHGDFSDGYLAWPAQREAPWTERFRVVIVDRRGYGRSPKAPRPYTIRGDAEDVAAVLAEDGRDEAYHVAGHSYGGLVALELALRYPERVRSLHLIEPAYLSLLPDDPDVIELVRRTREIRAQAHRWSAEAVTQAFFAALAGDEFAARLPEKPVWPLLLPHAERWLHGEFAADYPVSRLGKVPSRVPVWVYRGGRSHPALRRVAEAVAARLERPLIEVPEAYHDVQRAGESFTAAFFAAVDSMTVIGPR